MENNHAQLVERTRAAAEKQTPLRIVGGNSKAFYGQPVSGEVLDVKLYHGIVEYEPSELVISVRAGTPLREVEAALAERGQMLPFEPPHFGEGATIGGCVAAGLSGPARAGIYAGNRGCPCAFAPQRLFVVAEYKSGFDWRLRQAPARAC